MSKKGRIGYNITEKSLPEVSLPEHLLRSKKADLPEVSELDVVRHYTNVSQKEFWCRKWLLSTRFLYHEVQPKN